MNNKRKVNLDNVIRYPLYIFTYLSNCLKYRRKKVKLSFLEVWVGQRCTLKCRDCMHMIPYVKSQVYDIDELISDCKKIFSLCEVDFLSVLGGEPFTNKELYRFLEFVAACDNIKDGKLITNGTILPDEKTLAAIKGLNNKLDVRLDQYPGTDERVSHFYKIMQDNGIRCTLMRHSVWEEMRWKWVSCPTQQMVPSRASKKLYSECALKACYTMANGEFTVCPRGITTESVFGMKKNIFENVPVRKLKNNLFSRAWIATSISSNFYKDYCRYCLGLAVSNPFSIDPGIQLNDSERK